MVWRALCGAAPAEHVGSGQSAGPRCSDSDIWKLLEGTGDASVFPSWYCHSNPFPVALRSKSTKPVCSLGISFVVVAVGSLSHVLLSVTPRTAAR